VRECWMTGIRWPTLIFVDWLNSTVRTSDKKGAYPSRKHVRESWADDNLLPWQLHCLRWTCQGPIHTGPTDLHWLVCLKNVRLFFYTFRFVWCHSFWPRHNTACPQGEDRQGGLQIRTVAAGTCMVRQQRSATIYWCSSNWRVAQTA
jgi:hypothetical protein